MPAIKICSKCKEEKAPDAFRPQGSWCKAWQAAHHDHVQEAWRRYYAIRRDELLARLKLRRETRTATSRAYYLANREAILAKAKERYQRKKQREEA